MFVQAVAVRHVGRRSGSIADFKATGNLLESPGWREFSLFAHSERL